MYSDKKNILQLVALLEAHGITKVVLCPGSRNAPLVHTLSTHPGFTCYAMTDERSAGYFAIGLALNGGHPAAVCCTSGTALLNLHPIGLLLGLDRWRDRHCRSPVFFRHWSRNR